MCYSVQPIADLMITQQLANGTDTEMFVSGSALAYLITITNTGTSLATGITFTESLPSQLNYVIQFFMNSTDYRG